MPAPDFRKSYALSLINKLPIGKSPAFPHLSGLDVADGLKDRVDDPHNIDQGMASLCGPAAFFYVLLNFKPELYVQYVVDLFMTGKARIGSLSISPSDGARSYNPTAGSISDVDWIALASLRDSENTIMSYSSASKRVAGITVPRNIAHWLRAAGCFHGITDDTNYYICKGRKEIEAFGRELNMDRDICLFVNENIVKPDTVNLKSIIANHWIVVDSVESIDASGVAIKVFSWGDSYRIPFAGALTFDEFSKNFYGYVSAAPLYS
jgi:hypothetical protein